MMHISENAIAILKGLEGFRSYVYTCAGGELTIGYGTTNADAEIIGVKVKRGLSCSKKTADKWLRAVLAAKYEKLVQKYDAVYHWTQAEFDALVLFCYNIGSIKQLTADGTRSRAQIAEKMLLYVGAGGKANGGLLARRKTERRMFLFDKNAPVTNVGSNEEVHDMDTLKRGAKGQQVIVLQHELTRHGYKVAADGVFGAATENAVKAFQKALGLVADGVVGQKTWAALLK